MKHLNITFLLLMLLSMMGLKALAYNLAIENEDGVVIYYNYVNGGLEVTYKETTSRPRVHYLGNVVIPDSVEVAPGVKKAVVSIGVNAFEWCTALTSVTIPSTVTSVKSFAFYYCRMKTMVQGFLSIQGEIQVVKRSSSTISSHPSVDSKSPARQPWDF